MERRASRPSTRAFAAASRPGARLSTSKLFLCRRRVLRSGWCRGLRLSLRRFHSREHGRRPRSARRKNRKRDRREHENDCGPGRRPGKNRSRAPRAKRCLAALTAESRSQVAAFPALQQHDRNQKQANDNVNHYNQNGHLTKNSVRAAIRFKFRSSVKIRATQYDGSICRLPGNRGHLLAAYNRAHGSHEPRNQLRLVGKTIQRDPNLPFRFR